MYNTVCHTFTIKKNRVIQNLGFRYGVFVASNRHFSFSTSDFDFILAMTFVGGLLIVDHILAFLSSLVSAISKSLD